MAIKKRINIKKVHDRIEKKTLSNLQLLGNEINTGVVNRTQRGKDINLKPFKKYSSEYRKSKAKSHGSVVNLTVSGNMLNSITWKKITNGLRFYIGNNTERRKAIGNQKTRKFMGLDTRQKVYIAKKLNKL